LPGQAYDEHDPDEFERGHLPHVLVRDGEVIGTVRIDLIGDTQAGLRLIAHPPRSPAPRPRPRSAPARATNRARLRQDRNHHQPPPDVAALLPRQWLSRG